MTTCPVCKRELDEPCDVIELDKHRCQSNTRQRSFPAGHTATVLPFLRRDERLHEDDAA